MTLPRVSFKCHRYFVRLMPKSTLESVLGVSLIFSMRDGQSKGRGRRLRGTCRLAGDVRWMLGTVGVGRLIHSLLLSRSKLLFRQQEQYQQTRGRAQLLLNKQLRGQPNLRNGTLKDKNKD